MTTYSKLAAIGLAAFMAACGGGAAGGKGALNPSDDSGKKARDGTAVSKAAAKNFVRGLDQFVAHDKKQDWKGGTCESVAKIFLDANDEQKSDSGGKQLPEAVYNAGLAFQRCGEHEKAQAQFENALSIDGSFHRAKAQMALYDYKRTGDIDRAISELDQIIRDAKFQNVEGLVSLAALQMQRQGSSGGAGCADDLACAQLNLQRALAIDDSFMPAFNQLAAYYLEQAKAKAGKRGGRGKRRWMVVSGARGVDVNEQQLDLAALVASQAQRKNPNYAPIHNTTGLILVELKNFNGAVKAFDRARKLDPSFFEAHMNYAAVSLSFRGFAQAEEAYRAALKLRPKEYEAHLGLALAIRGQINSSNYDKFVKEAQQHLDQAKKIAPQRAETYYNEAILFQEFRAKRGKEAIPMLQEAAKRYKEFTSRAGEDKQFAQAVKRSNERIQDIEDTIKFIKEGEEAARQEKEAQKEAEKLRKQQEAEAKAAKEKEAKEKAAKEKADKAAKDKAAKDKAAKDKAAKDKSKPGAKPASKPPPTAAQKAATPKAPAKPAAKKK